MSDNVKQAKARIEALRAEQATLSAAVAALEVNAEQAQAVLGATLAHAERAPQARGIDHQQAVTTADETAGALADQLRRKNAALASVQADLAQAERDAEKARLMAEFDALYADAAEMASIAEALNTDIFNVPLWLRLIELTRRDTAKFASMRKYVGAMFPITDPYANPQEVLRGIADHEIWQLEFALQPAGDRRAIVPIDVAGALRLAFVAPRIDSLKAAVLAGLPE